MDECIDFKIIMSMSIFWTVIRAMCSSFKTLRDMCILKTLGYLYQDKDPLKAYYYRFILI